MPYCLYINRRSTNFQIYREVMRCTCFYTRQIRGRGWARLLTLPSGEASRLRGPHAQNQLSASNTNNFPQRVHLIYLFVSDTFHRIIPLFITWTPFIKSGIRPEEIHIYEPQWINLVNNSHAKSKNPGKLLYIFTDTQDRPAVFRGFFGINVHWMYCVGMKTKGIISSPQRQCSSARSKPCIMHGDKFNLIKPFIQSKPVMNCRARERGAIHDSTS